MARQRSLRSLPTLCATMAQKGEYIVKIGVQMGGSYACPARWATDAVTRGLSCAQHVLAPRQGKSIQHLSTWPKLDINSHFQANSVRSEGLVYNYSSNTGAIPPGSVMLACGPWPLMFSQVWLYKGKNLQALA